MVTSMSSAIDKMDRKSATTEKKQNHQQTGCDGYTWNTPPSSMRIHVQSQVGARRVLSSFDAHALY